MREIGERIQGKDMLDLPLDGGIIIHTSQVAHVTFYITDLQDGHYYLFSESEKYGMQRLEPSDYEHNYQDYFESYEDTISALAKAQIDLEQLLERKRSGSPTQKQIMFFFRNQMPIPLDLTWGQASDAIDEKLLQIAKEKETKLLEKFNGFSVGDRIYYFSRWDNKTSIGTITKLYQAGKSKYALVQMDEGWSLKTNDIASLKKVEEVPA